MREVLPGVFHWTALHPNIKVAVSSYWLEDDGVLIDPLIPPDLGVEWFAERTTSPAAIILTNRHHYRASDQLVQRFGCPVYCVRAGLHQFTRGEPVTGFDFGGELPGGLRAVEIGGLCPDDTALYLARLSAIWFADGVVSGGPRDQGAQLGFVPASLMDDPAETRRQLLGALERVLRDYPLEHVLLAHGEPLIGAGRIQLEELLSAGGRTAFEF